MSFKILLLLLLLFFTDFPEIAKEIQSLKLFAEQNEINKGINPQSDNNNDNNIKKNESTKANIASNKPEINNSNINNNNTIQKK